MKKDQQRIKIADACGKAKDAIRSQYIGHVPCHKCGQSHWMHGPCNPKRAMDITDDIQLIRELNASKHTLAKWLEWARMHGHLDHAAGIVDESRRIISSDKIIPPNSNNFRTVE